MISLFVKPKAQVNSSDWFWAIDKYYGLENFLGDYTSVGLTATRGNGRLYAVCDGFLSTRPPVFQQFTSNLPELDLNTELITPLSVGVYLNFHPRVVSSPEFEAQNIYGVTTAYYANIDLASLATAIGDAKLQKTYVSTDGPWTSEEVLQAFIRGELQIPVVRGAFIGHAHRPLTNERPKLNFVTLNRNGAVDPALFYTSVQNLIEVAGEVSLLPHFLTSEFLVEGVSLLDENTFLNRSVTELLPFALLQQAKEIFNYDYLQWRSIGNNQKNIYLDRLKSRAGIPSDPNNPAEHFNFNELDKYNLFQLEAIVEFYANFKEPFQQTDFPDASTENHITINFIPVSGTRGRLNGNMVTLEDDNLDFAQLLQWDQLSNEHGIYPYQEAMILLSGDTNRQGKCYRIKEVDLDNRILELDVADANDHPLLAGNADFTEWTIINRPTLVLVDPLGSRVNGKAAKIIGTEGEDKTIIELDIRSNRLVINKDCDTIYLPGDTANPSKRYKIIRGAYWKQTLTIKKNAVEFNNNNYDYNGASNTNPITDNTVDKLEDNTKRILVQGVPEFAAGKTTSAWAIPGGLGGELKHAKKEYFSRLLTLGYDTMGGWMFVVYNGQIRLLEKWTSFSSRKHLGDSNSSIAGNRLYYYYSHRSGSNRGINYSLKVVDKPLKQWKYDSCNEAKRYHLQDVVADTKGYIRIHHGYEAQLGSGTGSAGCQVSGKYYLLRNELIKIYQSELLATDQAEETNLNLLIDYKNQLRSEKIWCNTNSVTLKTCAKDSLKKIKTTKKIKSAEWIKKICGAYWLIRPEERNIKETTNDDNT